MNINDTIDQLRNARRLGTDSSRYKSWKRTIDNFGAWYHDTGTGTWLWSGTDATLEAWEQSIKSWQSWLRMTFPDTSSQLTEAPAVHKSPLGLPELPWYFWLGVGLGGTIVVVKMLKP